MISSPPQSSQSPAIKLQTQYIYCLNKWYTPRLSKQKYSHLAFDVNGNEWANLVNFDHIDSVVAIERSRVRPRHINPGTESYKNKINPVWLMSSVQTNLLQPTPALIPSSHCLRISLYKQILSGPNILCKFPLFSSDLPATVNLLRFHGKPRVRVSELLLCILALIYLLHYTQVHEWVQSRNDTLFESLHEI